MTTSAELSSHIETISHGMVELRSSAKLGLHLVAKEALGVGTVVLNEAPFFAFEHPVHSLQTEAAATPQRFQSFIAAFCRLSAAQQQTIMTDFYAADITGSQKLVATTGGFAHSLFADATAATSLPVILSTAQDLHKLLLISELNTHALGSRRALFRGHSKMTHSCDANCFFVGTTDGRAVHVATRPIASGELLTSNYLSPIIACASTTQRRLFLQRSKLFRCECLRCSLPVDKTRAQPCGVCMRNAAPPPTGTKEHMAIPSYCYPSGNAWICSQCGELPKDLQPNLGMELEIERAVVDWSETIGTGQVEVTHEVLGESLMTLTRDSEVMLGPKHWCSWRLRTFRVELAAQSACQPVSGHLSMSVLQQAFVSVLELFDDVVVWAASNKVGPLYLSRMTHSVVSSFLARDHFQAIRAFTAQAIAGKEKDNIHVAKSLTRIATHIAAIAAWQAVVGLALFGDSTPQSASLLRLFHNVSLAYPLADPDAPTATAATTETEATSRGKKKKKKSSSIEEATATTTTAVFEKCISYLVAHAQSAMLLHHRRFPPASEKERAEATPCDEFTRETLSYWLGFAIDVLEDNAARATAGPFGAALADVAAERAPLLARQRATERAGLLLARANVHLLDGKNFGAAAADAAQAGKMVQTLENVQAFPPAAALVVPAASCEALARQAEGDDAGARRTLKGALVAAEGFGMKDSADALRALLADTNGSHEQVVC